MKAIHKTVALVIVAIVDCVIGGVTLYDALTYVPKSEVDLNKMLELGSILNVDDETLLAYAPKEEIKEEPVKEVVVEQPKIVFDGLTMDQLAAKLNRSLKNELSGKGYLIASYSIQKGVDPYIATAIMLHETGCNWKCSRLVKQCNNVGGQKGKGCGSYRSFPTLDAGIKGMIDNLSKNYFSKGLKTPEQINKKYAESKTWYKSINNYVKKIKSK